MKISRNLVEHLKDKKTVDSFIEEYKALHDVMPAYANTFAGMLEISRGLNEIGDDNYLVIGGLAVAAYLHQLDSEAFRNWRGTDDIDLLVPDKKIAEDVLHKADYFFAQSLPSRIGVDGMLYDYVKEDNGENTKVGLRLGIVDQKGKDVTSRLLNHSSKIDVHGVKIAVPQLKTLLAMKRWAKRPKDMSDVRTLKSVMKKA